MRVNMMVALFCLVAMATQLEAAPRPPPPDAPVGGAATTPPAKVPLKISAKVNAEQSLRAAVVPSNSFSPPFEEYDESTGERVIQNAWATGGSTDVHENFVRLTNDRQSKLGWVHNEEPITMMDFSCYVNFRISGAGKRLFGDGIAIWVTDMTTADWNRGGELFGGPEDFKGFVVVLDTFKNSEMGSNHKDVMLFVNDGTGDVDLSSPAAGSVANYRYYEGRDDFSVLDYSSLHIMYRASTKMLTVMLDEKNTGEFKKAFEYEINDMPRGWDNELRLSFSATTGQLADNHDLLSVKLIKAGGRLPRSMDDEEVNPREIQSLERQVQKQSGGAQIAKLMKLYRRDAEMRLNHLHHAIEHELSFIQDSLASAIGKIKEAEQDDKDRIEMLEEKAEEMTKQILEQHVEKHLAKAVEEQVGEQLEQHVERKLDEKSKQLESQHKQFNDIVTDQHKSHAALVEDIVKNSTGGAGWITILVLGGVFGIMSFLISRRLSRIEKNHLP